MACIFQFYGLCLICTLTLTDKLSDVLNLHVVLVNLLKYLYLHNEPLDTNWHRLDKVRVILGLGLVHPTIVYMSKAVGHAELILMNNLYS